MAVDHREVAGGLVGLTAGEVLGGAVGGVAGAVVAGPVGAVVGAEVGAFAAGTLGLKFGTEAVRDFVEDAASTRDAGSPEEGTVRSRRLSETHKHGQVRPDGWLRCRRVSRQDIRGQARGLDRRTAWRGGRRPGGCGCGRRAAGARRLAPLQTRQGCGWTVVA